MLSMEDVYQEHSHMVYRYLLSLTHDADLAEELTQETFYQAIKKLDYFNAESKVSTWLCGIAKNLYGNLSYAEIGEIMGKSENWARVTFYRAKEQLRKELQNDK